MPEALAATPLISWHRSAGASLAPFAGYEMPIHYGSILREHEVCRSAAVLFDVSHMGRLRFDGPEAAAFLDHLLTRRVLDLAPGRVRYSLVCDATGGTLDDVLVSHLETPSGGRFHLLVVNASNRAKLFDWIEHQMAGFPGVTLSDRTQLTAMIAVQGPRAVEGCAKLFKFDPARLRYYRAMVTEQFGKPVIVSRSGYTGEDGLELIVRAEHAPRVWENLLLAGREHGFQPAGLGARDTLRLEAGMPLYGHELDETIDPISAGLEFACDWQSADLQERTFLGSEALRGVHRTGPTSVRVGLRIEGRRPAREGCAVLSEAGEPIGRVTSGTLSPTLGYPIAMGYVPREVSAPGTRIAIDIRGRNAAAEVVPLPFYRRPRP